MKFILSMCSDDADLPGELHVPADALKFEDMEIRHVDPMAAVLGNHVLVLRLLRNFVGNNWLGLACTCRSLRDAAYQSGLRIQPEPLTAADAEELTEEFQHLQSPGGTISLEQIEQLLPDWAIGRGLPGCMSVRELVHAMRAWGFSRRSSIEADSEIREAWDCGFDCITRCEAKSVNDVHQLLTAFGERWELEDLKSKADLADGHFSYAAFRKLTDRKEAEELILPAWMVPLRCARLKNTKC